ncbi:hypothetical protein OKW21_006057 [Catalinimonas alkaloidigena]|uniref:hypothetical protein n=1 Tax=Catalinimonas alkaloidigena TaxID=1075417 RepID=UPI002406E94D|nr:hypothetical protein [Catalinimonas alkaloidigena]MDF9800794.1 hypothetical protein [Catalinimonas alkaloidigena]
MKHTKEFKQLFIGFIVCFLTVALIDTVLSDCPETWKYGYETGRIVSNLALAYIASFIFYYFVVYRKERKDRLKLNEAIQHRNFLIYHAGLDVYRYLHLSTIEENERGENLFKDLLNVPTSLDDLAKVSKDDINRLCKNSKPDERTGSMFSLGKYSPYKIPENTFREKILDCINRVEVNTQKLLILSSHLEVDHIRILTAILETQLITNKKYTSYDGSLSTFKDLWEWFYLFFDKNRELVMYHNDHIKPMKNGNPRHHYY